MHNSEDIENYLEIRSSNLNYYVVLNSIFNFQDKKIERSQSVDSEYFKSYEHARRHAFSMIRKFGQFEGVEFRGSNF
tara:strand:+ start:814 stop:1044 length:231 start_codon:yes stop_codon:yes gene_type:complete